MNVEEDSRMINETEKQVIKLGTEVAEARNKIKILVNQLKVIRGYSARGLLIHHLCQEALDKIGEEG